MSADKRPEVLQALQDALGDSDWSVRAAAVHAIAVRNDPALESALVPLIDDRKEVRAAAGYLRLEAIRSAPVRLAPKSEPKKPLRASPSSAGKN